MGGGPFGLHNLGATSMERSAFSPGAKSGRVATERLVEKNDEMHVSQWQPIVTSKTFLHPPETTRQVTGVTHAHIRGQRMGNQGDRLWDAQL